MIYIVSYAYMSERHRKVFDFFKKKDDITLILPEIWKMKEGKITLKPELQGGINIVYLPVKFFHSRYPFIRGHLKGWMPGVNKFLRVRARAGDVLFAVHEPNLLISWLYGRLAKKLKMRFVLFSWQNVRFNDRLIGLKLKLIEWLVRKNLLLSDGLILGNGMAREVFTPYISKKLPILISPLSGLDTEKFQPGKQSNIREEYHLNNKIIVLFVGAFDNRKGLKTLLEAVKIAQTKNNDIHLLLIGSGEMENELKKIIIDKNIHATVLPWTDNRLLPGIFSVSDIFIYPSEPYRGWEEQFGYSIAEAASSGLPVISTSTGSIPDLVRQGQSGILVPPKNPEALSEAIVRLSSDPDLRSSLGFAGRYHIINNFSHRIIANKLENFLRSL